MNSEFIDEYDYENVQRKLMNSMHDEGYDEGFNNGYDSGYKGGKYEVIKSMLSNGLNINLISKITKLPKKEIEAISYEQ